MFQGTFLTYSTITYRVFIQRPVSIRYLLFHCLLYYPTPSFFMFDNIGTNLPQVKGESWSERLDFQPALFNKVKYNLKEMLEIGTICKSESPQSSDVVTVQKKNEPIRLCKAFFIINQKTIKNVYSSPRIEDTLHLLSGSRQFSNRSQILLFANGTQRGG